MLKNQNFNLTACPYDQQAFSPLIPTASWLSHLALVIYMFVVVNFDALTQASNIQIEKAGFEPGVSDTKSPADWMPADKPTELLRIKLVGFHMWFWQYTCLVLLISMIWHKQAIFESKGDNLSSFAECRVRTQDLRHQIAKFKAWTSDHVFFGI